MFAPSTSIRPAVGRSIPPTRFSSVVFPQPDGPLTATNSLSATCISSPRSAITSDFPVRCTLIRSFVHTLGMSTTSELQDASHIHSCDPPRDKQGSEEHRGGRDGDENEALWREHTEARHDGLRVSGWGELRKLERHVSGDEADGHTDAKADDHQPARFPEHAGR